MIKLSSKLKSIFGTHGEIAPTKTAPPLFITGCMRSGTTLLVDKLSSHPQLLKIGSELNKVWTEIGGANISETCDYKAREDANGHFTHQMSSYFFKCINESKSFKRHLMRAQILRKKKLGRIRYDWDNIIPVNKSTHLMNKIGYVNGLFPKSKIIVIIRDIFAHSASMKAHFDLTSQSSNQLYHFNEEKPHSCWGTVALNETNKSTTNASTYPSNFELIPKMWLRMNSTALNTLNQLDSDQYIIISYEKLINEQEKTFEVIFDFLQLEKQHSDSENKIKETVIAYKNTSTKGNPLTKWRNTLSKKEIDIINQVILENSELYNSINSRYSS